MFLMILVFVIGINFISVIQFDSDLKRMFFLLVNMVVLVFMCFFNFKLIFCFDEFID